MTAPAEPEQRLTECYCFTDEDYPYCNDRAMPCRYKDQVSRRKCPDYKSAIHHQVECDVRQGTMFAQRMVSDVIGEPIYNIQHPCPQEPQCNWALKNLLRVYKEDSETDKDLFPPIYYDGKITAINQAIMEIEATSAITPDQCPHWECIEHSDGMEWCCNKVTITPPKMASEGAMSTRPVLCPCWIEPSDPEGTVGTCEDNSFGECRYPNDPEKWERCEHHAVKSVCEHGYPQYPTPPEDYPKTSFKIEPCKRLEEHDSEIIAAAIAEHERNRDESSLAALHKINDALQKLYPADFALQLNAKQLDQLQAEHDEQVRKEERERVLDELRKNYVQSFDDPNVHDQMKNAFHMIDTWIKSLRGGERK